MIVLNSGAGSVFKTISVHDLLPLLQHKRLKQTEKSVFAFCIKKQSSVCQRVFNDVETIIPGSRAASPDRSKRY
jgi:hypothetical protein